MEGMQPNARLQKILAKDESYQIGGCRLALGDFTASDQEVVDHLLEIHFPGFQPIMENTARDMPVRTPTEEDWLVASEAVDSDKIRWAIEGFGSLDHSLKSSRLFLLWDIYRRRGKG
jgi:hypothetical protein